MANCKFCGKPVAVSPVWHSDCFEDAADEIAAVVCDDLCKYREAYGADQDALNREHCDSCVMNRLLDLGQ